MSKKIKATLRKSRLPEMPQGEFSYHLDVPGANYEIEERQFHELLDLLVFDEEEDIFFESDEEFDRSDEQFESDQKMLSGFMFMKYTGEMEESVWDGWAFLNLSDHIDLINHPDFLPALAEVFGVDLEKINEEDEKPGWEEDPDFWK